MNYSDDGYAAMLLTLAFSPDREEYARPYGVQEYRALEARVRNSDLKRMGRLLNLDISGMMIYLGMSEEEAYRAFTLLNRSVQLTYALEAFAREGIAVVTCYDREYPQRLKRKLGDGAPVCFYLCGEQALLSRPSIAVVGIQGVRTDDSVRAALDYLVKNAVERGYGIVTGGELGVSRMAATLTAGCGGSLLDVLGGGMMDHVHLDGIAELIAAGQGAALSLVHPRALFTVSHAIARNKLLFSMADAAFIFNTDGHRGEVDALQSRCCDWIYAWEDYPQNRGLISRGAIPMGRLEKLDFEDMSRHWNSSNAEQMSMFDLF